MALVALGVEQIKQYPGRDQVDLAVEIEVPGSWFSGTSMGALTASERREKYKAQAVEYVFTSQVFWCVEMKILSVQC